MKFPPEAIERFLNKPPRWLPQFKHADPETLTNLIWDVTGQRCKFLTPPRPHQLEGLAFAIYQQRCLLFYGMRLGKTKLSLDWAAHLRRGGQWRGKGLVIVHSPIGLDVWDSQIRQHSRLRAAFVRNQMDELLEALEGPSDLVVVPWSGLQNILTTTRFKQGKAKLYPDRESIDIVAEALNLAIIDEIHTAKNHRSLRFKIASRLIQNCRFRLGLTGTSFGRNPMDVWAQAYLIDGGETLSDNYYFFEEAFGVAKKNYFSGYTEYTFDKKKKTILQEKLSGLSLTYAMEEVQNVNVLAGTIDLHLYGEQRVAYQDVVNKLVKLSDNQSVEIQATFVRLRQVSSGYLPFVDDRGVEHVMRFKENPKLEWLREFVEQEEIPPTIIFHEFTRSGEDILEVLSKAKMSTGWLNGATKDRGGLVNKFQSGEIQVLVCQSAAGSMGIELNRADYMLFYEAPVSTTIRIQAEARPLADRTKPLIVDDLICSGVERKILEFAKDGKNLLTSILRDRSRLLSEDRDGSSFVKPSSNPRTDRHKAQNHGS